jgi:two-component system response regulator (stage 0 sporulation protein A)
MVKPFDMQLLYDRITEIALEREAIVTESRREEAGETADEKITNLFLTLGIPAHIKGYQYLREAVRMVMDDHTLINRITKELYPGVAKAYATSASKVERAMRHAIEVAWNRGRLETVNHMYGYRVFDKQDKPTNGEFIALVADKIAMKKSA